MLSRFVCFNSVPLKSKIFLGALRTFTQSTPNGVRHGGQRVSQNFGVGSATRQTLRERLLGPTTGKPFIYGTGAVAGASLLGIGALCYYGLGLSKQQSILSQSELWPVYVRDRIKSTYGYLFGSLGLTAAAALAASRSYQLTRLVTNSPFITMAAVIASSILVSSIDYDRTFIKHAAWALHAGVLGTMLGPMCIYGGPVIVRAAYYTAALVAGLSTIALTAPSEKFLMMGGPLAMGLALVFAANIGTFFLPPQSALGASLMSITVYGGLILFSMFLLYDTQLVVKRARSYPITGTSEERTYQPGYYGGFGQIDTPMPTSGIRRYDPINSQLSIFADVLNIFIRIAMILMGTQGRKR